MTNQFFEKFFAFSIIGIIIWVIASVALIIYFMVIYFFFKGGIDMVYYALGSVVSLVLAFLAMKKFVDWEN